MFYSGGYKSYGLLLAFYIASINKYGSLYYIFPIINFNLKSTLASKETLVNNRNNIV